MILSALLTILETILGALFLLLPDWTPFDITGATEGWESYSPTFGVLAWTNQYVPISEGFALGGLVLTVFAAAFAYRSVVWLLTKLHVLGGSSD